MFSCSSMNLSFTISWFVSGKSLTLNDRVSLSLIACNKSSSMLPSTAGLTSDDINYPEMTEVFFGEKLLMCSLFAFVLKEDSGVTSYIRLFDAPRTL